MIRRLPPLVTVALLAAACSSGTAQSTSTVAVEEPSTTTTTVETTTTTVANEPVDICGGGGTGLWKPGTTYVADCFLVPVAFEPEDEGWQSRLAKELAIWGSWTEPGDGFPTAHFTILAFEPSRPPEEIVELIPAVNDGVHRIAGPDTVERGGLLSQTIDVVTDPVAGAFPSECAVGARNAVGGAPGLEPVYGLLPMTLDERMPGSFGFGACRSFRVWVFEVADRAVTVTWTPDDVDRFGELVPVFERLLDSMTFERP